ncbi:RnfABCDGE type electron transport complex subunit D [Cellulosilyticum sp. I15G10I2]|uniref:RnfABCDGE type electron transport complex subunit D n=1 Tax=Cellulosilyticum sp. I15G10I2 TaxID=1892843 RepID=UPI00085C5527|nr:RnfABCDGE type electron transport complex subunit D [Cellulosilyticum sp. I15G10I2]
MEKVLKVSSSPHVRANHTTQSIMRDVIIALIPAMLAGILFFGIRALWVTLISIIACVLFEWGWQKVFKMQITVFDLSAVVTGLLLAFNLPVSTPYYIVVVGAFVAIILTKQIFGGIGQNFINPALAARAFLLAAYPTAMTDFTLPARAVSGIDTVSGATPLALLKQGVFETLPSFSDAFIGNTAGCIGEASALALLLGAAYLFYKKIIKWHIPVFYIATIFIITYLFNGFDSYMSFYSLFLGGIMLGAFFMATDYTTSPMTVKGQIIFAVGAGVITSMIRLFGGYPEGVSYSILMMNLAVPLIDRYVKTRRFGGGEKA